MTNEELLKSVEEYAKYIKMLGYVQFVLSIPLLIESVAYFLMVLTTGFLAYYGQKLFGKINEFSEDFDKDELYIAEDCLDQSLESVNRINIISFLLLISTTGIFGVLIQSIPIYTYLLFSVVIYIVYIFLCKYLEPAIKSLIFGIQFYRDQKEGIKRSYYL